MDLSYSPSDSSSTLTEHMFHYIIYYEYNKHRQFFNNNNVFIMLCFK